MIFTKDLPVDDNYPESCVYWIYHEDKHTDIFSEGYVGVSALGSVVRFTQHKCDAKTRSNNPVHNAIIKYGDKMKCVTVIMADPELCYLLEEMLRPSPKIGYNIAIGGGMAPMLGMKHSEEVKKKMSEDRKGEKASMWGRQHSEESKQKISLANTGRCRSPEEKLAASLRMSGDKNPFKGKVQPPEVIAFLAEINTGREISEQTRQKMSASQKQRKREVKEKPVRKSVHTDEYKRLMSERQFEKFSSPWNVPRCNASVWRLAEDIFSYHCEHPSHKGTAIGKVFGLAESSVKTILRKINNGWNPSLDGEFLIWLTKQKETTNATSTTSLT